MQVKLKVLSGTQEGKDVPVKQEKFLIGRSESCQLRPKSESISRKHCALVQKEGRLLVLDLKSRNGTFVNDTQLVPEKAKVLKNGDRLKVGALEFEVLIEVGLGGAKRSEIKDVKHAAERVASVGNADSRVEDVDISSWLEEADQIDRSPAAGQETRQFVLDDTSRIDLTISNSEGETKLDSTSSESQEKENVNKGPIKMPKMHKGPTTKNSRDAASETLKKYFGGRG